MKTITNTVFLHIFFIIVLCTGNVLTLCGNDKQIDDLNTALMIHEASYTVLTTLSAIPITGTALAIAQIVTCAQFSVHFSRAFQEMESSLDKDHLNYKPCLNILDKALLSTSVIKSTGLGLSLASILPGFGLALLPPRIASSIASIVIIKDCLEFWKKKNCQFATTRDCNL